MFGIGEKKTKEPKYINSVLNNPMLNYRAYVMSPVESVIVRLMVFMAGGLVGLLFYGNLFMVDGFPTKATRISNYFFFVLLGIVAMLVFVPLYRDSRLEARRLKLSRQFRDFLEALSSSLTTGSNINDAFHSALEDLQRQYDNDEAIVTEVREICQATQQGFSLDAVFKDFAERSGDEDIESFGDILNVCYHLGGSLVYVVEQTRLVNMEKAAVTDEIQTKLTSNKLQHNVMSVMPIALMAMLRLTNDSFAENLSTPMGVLANTVALVIFIGSYIYGRRLVDIKV